MKSSTILVVAVAVVSSVATVAAIELLRGSRPVSQPALAVEQPIATSAARASQTSQEEEPLPPATQALDPLAGYEDRLAELERRLAALERAPTRQPAATASSVEELPPEDELRDLVLAWVAQDREALGRSEKLDAEAERRAKRAFDARFGAYMFALEHGLARWQEENFAELYLETEERRDEIEDSIDLSSGDPAEIEARWAEFDEPAPMGCEPRARRWPGCMWPLTELRCSPRPGALQPDVTHDGERVSRRGIGIEFVARRPVSSSGRMNARSSARWLDRGGKQTLERAAA